jgi:ribonucleoside-diphosphate reductase alpha chain
MPETRRSLTHRVAIQSATTGETELYITTGYHDDGTLGEVFAHIGKQGSTLQGLFDSWSILFSVALQYGVPIESLITKFRHVAFEPAGGTDQKGIAECSSVIDYVVQWLDQHGTIEPLPLGERTTDDGGITTEPGVSE